MRNKAVRHQDVAKRSIKNFRRQTRKRYSSEEKIRIVLAGLRGYLGCGSLVLSYILTRISE